MRDCASDADRIRDAHSAIRAQYIADEPDGSGKGLDPLWLEDTVATIRARDPYHPITIVLNCVENPYRTVSDYSVYADIVMADPYPIGLRNPVCPSSENGAALDGRPESG